MTTVAERDLAECEEIIARNLTAFLEVGAALLRIREARLYKADGFASFDSYCRERWGMGRKYADRTIRAAETVRNNPDSFTANSGSDAGPASHPTEWSIRNHIAEHSTVLDPLNVPAPIPTDWDAIRCAEIMDELRANGRLAMLVRKALTEWYALNS